jgi:hypothetical protein
VLPSLLIAALALAAGAGPLDAQTPRPARAFGSGMKYGIGYTAAVPEAVLGLGGFAFFGESRLGAFADFKITVPSLSNDDFYCPAPIDPCTVDFVEANRNDNELQVIDEWMLFNGGVMYAVTPELAFLAGAGIVRKTVFREFFHDEQDPAERITPTGGYYVDDDEGSGWEPQFVGGVLFRAGPRLAFRIGYETAPGGMSVGAYIVP